MKFTHDDYKRLHGDTTPTYYTTPPDWAQCKNLNQHGVTPCWHPHCDCFGPPATAAKEESPSPRVWAKILGWLS